MELDLEWWRARARGVEGISILIVQISATCRPSRRVHNTGTYNGTVQAISILHLTGYLSLLDTVLLGRLMMLLRLQSRR